MDNILFIGAPGKLLFSQSFKNSFLKLNYKRIGKFYWQNLSLLI